MEVNTPVNIEDEMKRSYMDYAMSVIIGRALPDVRDGLKPVQRRIIYSMHEMGNYWNRPYKKSARIVGDVIGKYHPHGDAAVYETIVRMAQDFSLRYPLIDGQGNFGSIDGDPPAAMRYTEVRMAQITHELLKDIDKETVDFLPNYDESLKEPAVLPSRFPNLLVNGSSGIAVGMTTNIPPHNLKEVIEGLIFLINNPDASIDELIDIIPGPDFPTGGYIYGKDGIISAYKNGKGTIQLRAKAFIDKYKKGERIVISELPYQVNKARLLEKISELIRNKRIEGISEVRDESDREGMRIVIELKKDEIAQVILNKLYKHTQMECNFGIINLSIVDNQPKLLNLKEILSLFINHRKDVVRKRSLYELNKAKDRIHILEGLKIALSNIDRVINLIKRSENPSRAKEGLIREFSLSQRQAEAILEMRLQRLTSLEREKIDEEYNTLLRDIERLKEILTNERILLDVIIDELNELKEKYGDERRTEIIEERKEIKLEDLIVEEDMVVTITNYGYIKRTPVSIYRSQKKGGRGVSGMETNEKDFVKHLFIASTHSSILYFLENGKVYWLKVHEIPEGSRLSKGKAIVNLLKIEPGMKISTILPIKEFIPNRYIIMVTKNGLIKKCDLSLFKNIRSKGITAISINSNDRLISAGLTDGDKDIFIGTKKGIAIRFKEDKVRAMGRGAHGVKGINIKDSDEVVSMYIIEDENNTILTVSENGYGKRTKITDYPLRNRGGRGVITIKSNSKVGNVVGIVEVKGDENIMLVADKGKIIRFMSKDIPVMGRNTQGIRLVRLEEGERVTDVAKVIND
jgi:DNA gyrase subunit A